MIAELAGAVQSGSVGLVTIVGEAGVGKTSLLAEAVDQLERHGFAVLRVALSEVEAHLSWAGLRLLCASLTDDDWAGVAEAPRQAVLAAIGRIDQAEADPSLVAFGLADVVRGLARQRPTALVVDDLHWLDQPSASAIAFAIRASDRLPLMAILAHRPVDLAIDPDRLVADERRRAIELSGLSVGSVHQLVSAVGRRQIGRTDALRIHEATGGHALHAIEIGRLLARGIGLDDALVHRSAYDAIASRIDDLPAGTRDMLLLAALAARPTITRIRAAMPGSDAESELDVAIKHHVVDVHGDQIRFVHPLMRSAVVATASLGERRRAQVALAATADDEDERVSLRAAGALDPDADLAAELDAAAERAGSRGDVPVALQFAQRAVELTPPSDVAGRVDRLLSAAELALSGGEADLPVTLATRAEALDGSAPTRFRAGVVKFLAIGNAGDVEGALALSEELLPSLTDQPGMRARLHDLRTQALLRFDVTEAGEAAEAAVVDAIAGGDHDQIVREEALRSMVRVLAGEPVDLELARTMAAGLPNVSIAKDWWADVLSYSDQAAASLEISRGQLVEYQRLGLVHFEAPVRSRMIGDLIALGRYDEALRHAEDWLDLQAMIGGIGSANVRIDIAYIAAIRGDDARATHELARSMDDDGYPIDQLVRFSRACEVAATAGDWRAAAEHGRAAARVAAEIGCGAIGSASFRVALVEALVQLGEFGEATEVADHTAALVARSATPRGAADIARNAALLAVGAGDLDAALGQWSVAEARYAELGLALETVRAVLGAGSVLRRMGKRGDARIRLTEARQRFVELGAFAFLARTDAELDRLGARRTDHDQQLTPTEEQIAELVAEGRSNAEIAAALSVSLRTVESNLTRAYRKFGVRSRTELAAALRNRPG